MFLTCEKLQKDYLRLKLAELTALVIGFKINSIDCYGGGGGCFATSLTGRLKDNPQNFQIPHRHHYAYALSSNRVDYRLGTCLGKCYCYSLSS